MISYKKTTASHPDFKKLITELDKELWVRYPKTQQNFTPFNFIDETAKIILAFENDEVIGCGCFRPMEEERTVEFKRMYVVPTFRNKGVGKSILQKLEEWATSEGFVFGKLETGNNQPEAVSAYEKSGFVRIPNFGPYVNMKESICMMKLL